MLREQGPLTSPLRDAAATARAEAQTPPPLPDPGPQERLAADVLRQVQVALDPARRSMLVRLNPRELGSISIRLELGAGRVRAVLRAENPRALELLERHLPELRAALAAQGLETEDIDLGLAEQGPRRQHEESRAQEGSAGRKPATDALVHETTVALDLRSISAGLGLDTYA